MDFSSSESQFVSYGPKVMRVTGGFNMVCFQIITSSSGDRPTIASKKRGGKLASWSLCYFGLFYVRNAAGKSKELPFFPCLPTRPSDSTKILQSLRIKLCKKKSNLNRLDEENMGNWRRWSHGRRAEDTYREEIKWNQSAQIRIQRVTCMGLRSPRTGSHLDGVRDGGQ